jgi:acyl carrier protein
MDTVDSKVRSILELQLGVEAEEMADDSRIVEDLSADSLDTIEIVMACEDEFGIEIADEDAEKIHTVAEMTLYLERRVLAKSEAAGKA